MKNTKYLVRNEVRNETYECKNVSEVKAAIWGRLHECNIYKRVETDSECDVGKVGKIALDFGK